MPALARAGRGGGGSGGSILIRANTAVLGSSLVTANGGVGGAASAPGAGGGSGGVGRIRIEAGSVTGTTSPVASTGNAPTTGGATWAAAEDTLLVGLAKNTPKRLRLQISNEGTAAATGTTYRLEVSGANPASCATATYSAVPTTATGHWQIVDSLNLTDGSATTNVTPGLTDENTAFVAGQVKDTGNQTTGISLSTTEFTEIEFALQATANATNGALYCFRLTNAGSTTNFTYGRYAQATVGIADFLVEAAGGGAIGTQTAGTPFSIRITARDSLGNTVTTFNDTVDITSTGTLSAGGGTTAAFTNGVLASHSVTISNTGTFTITATRTAGTETGTSNSFTVNAGAASQLAFVTQPGNGVAGQALSPQPVVEVRDSLGNPVTKDPTPWWNSSYLYRQKITVTAGSVSVPSGYSVAVILNHASLVTAGKSLLSGNDVRVVYWNGASWVELDRVLDSGSAWNNSSTKIWFRTQAAIAASASDGNYHLYYGNPSAVAPPTNPANVFLFSDDFESGTLGKWTVLNGLWQIATDQPRSGTYALKYPAETGLDAHIDANPALNEANIYFDAWWRFNDAGTVDIAQVVRGAGGATNHSGYETNLEGTAGWDIAKQISGAWSELAPNAGTPAANTWTRIGVAIYGTGVRIFKDGTQINPASGSFNVGTELASGNVGFRKWAIGTGFRAWWVDDVVARRYVDPEPTTGLAAEETSGAATETVTVAFTTGTNEEGATLSGTTTVNINWATGRATFTDLSVNLVGSYQLTATTNITGVSSTNSTAFSVSAGAATKLAFSVQPSNTAGGAIITPAIKVQVQDAGGNLVTSATNPITLAIGTNPSGGTLSGTLTVAAVGGEATFSDISINKAGTGYTLTASATGLTGATSASFNITVG
ncbi:MAG: DUF2341 domain-containing protein, partial [candidate division KSB1 bacterium]|nr:DUF2341 domain-containing protein [candidate division KSB1 bacterium]